MKSVNTVNLIGRAGKDPEIKYFDQNGTGKAKAWFNLATDEGKGKDGQKITQWHNIIMWEKTAELASDMIRKGRLVYLAGRIIYREYKDKEGNKHKITEIIAHDFMLLDRDPRDPKERELALVGAANESTDEVPF